MAPLDIVTYGAPSLRERSAPIDPAEINDALRGLIADMAETMRTEKGIGLAAPQVGRNIRLFICDIGAVAEEPSDLRAFINPEIVEESDEDGPYTEGCLSLPEIEGEVHRPLRVKVRALDEHGASFELEADGLLARVIQHERDHLDGVLFIDRMRREERALLAGQLAALRRATEAKG